MKNTPISARAAVWTPKEDEILRELYPTFGAVALAKRIPGRTVTAITLRARNLKVSCQFKGRVPLRVVQSRTVRDNVIVGAFRADGSEVSLEHTAAKPIPVPASAISLPWVRYPDNPAELRAAADLLEASITPPASMPVFTFMTSQAEQLRALAARQEAQAAQVQPAPSRPQPIAA